MKIPYPFKEWQDLADAYESARFNAKDHVVCGEILDYSSVYDGGTKYHGVMLKTDNVRLEHITLGPCTLIGYRANDDSDPSEDAPTGDNAAIIPDTIPDNEYWTRWVCKLTKRGKRFFFAYPSALRPLT